MTTLVCFAFQPETKGATLEEVEKAFEISPWRVALARHRQSTRQTRRQSSPPGDPVIAQGIVHDLDIIELPEVRYGGPWHYAHR